MTDETAVVPAEFREIATTPGSSVTVALPPAPDFWQVVPIHPSWTRLKKIKNPETGEWEEKEVPYFVDSKVFSQPTPKHEKKRHFKGYFYTSADFARKQLNKAADFGRWRWHELEPMLGREYTQLVGKNQEKKVYQFVKVEGWLLVPGYPPAYGVGEAPWAKDDVGDPRFSFATAQKAASSLALKDAAKRGFGIGADISEDEETAQAVTGVQTTCVNLFEILSKKSPEKKEKAIKIVNKHAPIALVGDKLVAEAIDEGVMDNLLTELTKEATAA